MKEEFKKQGVFRLKDYIDYKDNAINRVEVESNDKMKFFMMSFDKHCLLAEHAAPGNAILTVLEGKATINYKGEDYDLVEGDNFVFLKGELHSVYSTEKLKVSLLLDLA